MADVSRHLVIDGSNIATEGRSLPSLAQLDEAVRAFVEERPHETWTVVVDATFGHRIDASEKQVYEEALAANELVTPPAGTIGRGDKFLLEIADRSGATVFSNDSFQEFHGEYDWLFDEGRLVGGKPVPEVGWIFTERTPVRGPKSRMATRGSGERRGRLSASGRSGGSGRVLSATASGPPPVPTMPPPRPARHELVRAPRIAAASEEPVMAVEIERESMATPRRRPSPSLSLEAVNEPLPFIEFIAEHGPGEEVEGEVLTFTSHGAFIQVGGTRCYLALKFMGDPAPRSARDLLHRGEVRTFIVQAIDAPRRGIDLAMPGFEEIDAAHAPTSAAVSAVPATPVAKSRSRAKAKSEASFESSAESSATATQVVAPARPARRVRTSGVATSVVAASDDAGRGEEAVEGVATRREPSSGDRPSRVRRARQIVAVPLETPETMPAAEITGATSARGESTPEVEEVVTKKAAARGVAKKAPAKKAVSTKRVATRKAVAKKSAAAKMPATEVVAESPPPPDAPPDLMSPKATAPETTASQTTAPQTTAPDRMSPDVVQPGVLTPDVTTADPAGKTSAGAAKKATTKKAAAKKATTKKSTTKKAAVKKVAAKKAITKKAVAKKAVAKRTTTKKKKEAPDPADEVAGVDATAEDV